MADTTVTLIGAAGAAVPVRYKDNGDGSYSPGAAAGYSAVSTGPTTMTAQTATIANGGTVSTAFDLRGYATFGLVIPAAFTGTSVSFQVSADNATFQALYDITGALVAVPVIQGRSYDLPLEFAVWPYTKVVSNAAEGGARSLTLVGKG